MAIRRFVAIGRRRAVPRHWMRGLVAQEPGTVFVYCHDRPGVCAIVCDGAVVTIVTRELFGDRRQHLRAVPEPPRPVPASERARWRWNGMTEEAEEDAA